MKEELFSYGLLPTACRITMPHFDDFYAAKLRGSLGVREAEATLDLRLSHEAQAIASLDALVERSRFSTGQRVAILLAPPPEGGGETLFQPVGRHLLAAKRRGLIGRLHPLPAEDGLGFYAELVGRAQD